MTFNPKDFLTLALVGGGLYYTLSKKQAPEWLVLGSLASSIITLTEAGKNIGDTARAARSAQGAEMAGLPCQCKH